MATDKLVDFDHVTDYISREAASDLLAMALIDEWEPEYAQDRLSEIPAADVRPVVLGKWVSVHDGYGICSNCHRGNHVDPLAGFCRFCGADMREVDADGES